MTAINSPDLEVGSQEWLAMRRQCVTATDAGIINGTNPYCSVHKLLGRKLKVIPEQVDNELMAEGRKLEAEARLIYNMDNETNFEPKTAVSKEYPWLIAHLDGYYQGKVLEIKCGEASYKEAVKSDIPLYYYDQMQHQMYASNTETAIYLCYRPDLPLIAREVTFDKKYFAKLLKKEIAFYEKMRTTEVVRDKKTVELSYALKQAKEETARAQKREKELQEEFYKRLPDKDCFAGCVNVRTTTRKGNVNWKILCKNVGISETTKDLFRNDDIVYRQAIVIL